MFSSTSVVTIAPAATTHPFPIVTPGRMRTSAPIQHFSFICIVLYTSLPARRAPPRGGGVVVGGEAGGAWGGARGGGG